MENLVLKINKKAFTLVELAIVAIIVGLLALVAIPNMLKAVNRGYAKDAMRNLMAIYAAAENYRQKNGGYPATTPCDLNCIKSSLEVNIVPTASLDYHCDYIINTNSYFCQAGTAGSVFVMRIESRYPISSSQNPVYCNAGGVPDSTYNPCCFTNVVSLYGQSCP